MSSDAAVTLFSVHELVTHILSYADLPTLSTLSAVSSRLCKLSRGVKLGDVDWRLLHRDEVLLDQWMSSAHRACKCEWPVHRKMQAGYPTGYDGLRSVDLRCGWIAATGGNLSPFAHLWIPCKHGGTCKHAISLAHDDDEVVCVAIRPNGLGLATACRSGEIRVWDLGDIGEAASSWEEAPAHTGDVFALVWTDEDTLLSGGVDRVLRSSSFREAGAAQTLIERRDTSSVVALAFDAQLKLVASPQRDYSIHLLSSASAGELETRTRLIGHTRPVLAVAIGGGRVASGGCGGCIRLWSASSGECTAKLASPATYALGLHGESMLVSGGCGETCVRVWRLKAPLAESSAGTRADSTSSSDGDVSERVEAEAAGQVVARLNRPDGGGGSPCVLALDGERVVSGDGAVCMPASWMVKL